MTADWRGASDRIKGLISASDKAQLANAAERLGVDEQHLREAIAQESLPSMLRVIAAIVRVYGLDPSWVLTGNYDPATHRIALQHDAAAVDRILSRLLEEGPGTDRNGREAIES